MNRYKMLITGIVLLLSIPLVSAEITIDIQIQDSFGLGEDVFFNYTLTSDTDTQAIIIPDVECPSAPSRKIVEKTVNLTKNVPHRDSYSWMAVQDFFEPQTCTAYIRFLTPAQDRVIKTFTIDTDPSFSFVLKTCKDQSCTEKSKIFLKNENIYLDYDSGVGNPSITATLTYPDKTPRTLTLPTSIKAEQIGTHTLKVTASKQGYQGATTQSQFAVIEQEADIPYVSVCNANGICEEGENEQNCPQDCEKPGFDWTYLAYAAVIVVIIFVVLIIIIKLASSGKRTQPEYSYAKDYMRTQ